MQNDKTKNRRFDTKRMDNGKPNKVYAILMEGLINFGRGEFEY